MARSLISPKLCVLWTVVLLCGLCATGGCLIETAPVGVETAGRQSTQSDIERRYRKSEYRIRMRDGAHLFTAVYTPRDESRKYPIMMLRTPYSVRPYGDDAYRDSLGPSRWFSHKGFIFVYQDVRGRHMSEGEFVNMRPHVSLKSGPGDIDESTDTYDTIDWLIHNIPNHNGKVGMWGISYPGFYAAAGMIDAHPALAAVSPQAPIADWFFDDFHHHGAFFLPHYFNFFATFGRPRPEPTTQSEPRFDHGTRDGYRFFMDLGPLRNVNERYYKNGIAFWNETVEHPDYDRFWQERNILPHLSNVAPGVMTVGGWFDAEDLYGALNIYRSVETRNPGVTNTLVMGPWRHGGWARTTGQQLGDIQFGSATSQFYQEHIEFPFFDHYLYGRAGVRLPEAFVFETGANEWRQFDDWPPRDAESDRFYFHSDGGLSGDAPTGGEVEFDEYVSDPGKPVPSTQRIDIGMPKEYMTEDQRFAARRPDVAVFETEPLSQPVTIAGPIQAELWVSTSGTDSDWIVKVIDVLPPDTPDPEGLPESTHLSEYQMMVRSEVFRGRYRNSYQYPEPFVPNEPTRVSFELQDVLHTFEPGHRVMVQVHSTWFPMVDRNPQTYVPNIFRADESDFIKATQRVYHSPDHPSRIDFLTLQEKPDSRRDAS